ncbi:glycosyltransferase family 2 protein [Blastococcus sp. Marseille-P5729]|uniref:glycosyltransferase family 2 protein n=1 Tax=Blastococcus sp. Marseille-P5729 TaxID=2086582 RepID=UPI000D0E6CD5|nr:glycosyltransferase family 2 protein [Blastococcus sp. Marseille-P5729]
MHAGVPVAVVVPAFNEQLLITRAVETVPEIVDYIIVVNDGSSDETGPILDRLTASEPRLTPIHLTPNRGIGGALKAGYRYALDHTDAQIIGTLAGDAQCDPTYIPEMLEVFTREQLDFVKATRFRHKEALRAMPTYRGIGNRVITVLTSISTGYYNLTDSQNGYGFFSRGVFERLDWDLVGERYDYENTMLTALARLDAKLLEVGVPAIYGQETSTIKFLPTTVRALKAVSSGFAQRYAQHARTAGLDAFTGLIAAGASLNTVGAAVAGSGVLGRRASWRRSGFTLAAAGTAALVAGIGVDARNVQRRRRCGRSV